ncbi:MAG: hypothetical protein UX13_C0003G0017 [Candidatus Woesebacteria bacterium GW2011_GWB1_45_5]|uniref:Uncharacterized protein n=1 Tax=Candidatus Woesebacteria bacterium GW2011_GWB1_45_5 TaxID=1618581 RepID=A0A0G1QQ91_9BACT|nr:MAG: hypothetical protein UX13_C0003G0017 [Candidatus Woesebacteria bacterium GW2011_GWB1_45_5]
MELNSVSEACRWVVKQEVQKDGVYFVRLKEAVNPHHRILVFEKGGIGYELYVLFKRSGKFFYSYDKIFKQGDGAGETINLDVLDTIVSSGRCPYIAVCYANGKIYKVDPKRWMEYAISHGTIREQYAGEKTASVPMALLCELR